MENQNNYTYSTEKICPRCHSVNRANTNYCGVCGEKLSDMQNSYTEHYNPAPKAQKPKTFPAYAIVLLVFTVLCYFLSGLFSLIGSVMVFISEDYITGDGEIYQDTPDENYDFYDKFDEYFENYLNPEQPYQDEYKDGFEDEGTLSNQTSPEAYLDGVPVYTYDSTLIIEDIELTILSPQSKKDDDGNFTSVDFSIYNGMSGNTLAIQRTCFEILALNDTPPIDCSDIFNGKADTVSRKLLFPGESFTGTLRFDDCKFTEYDSMLYCNFKIGNRTIEFFVKK